MTRRREISLKSSHLANHSTDICSQWPGPGGGHWDTVMKKTDVGGRCKRTLKQVLRIGDDCKRDMIYLGRERQAGLSQEMSFKWRATT